MSDQQTHPPAPAGDHGSVASAQPTAEDVELQQLDLSALQAPSQPSPAPQSTTQATGSSQPGDALAAVAAAADQHHQHRENTFDKDSDLSQLLPTLGQSPAPSSVSQGASNPPASGPGFFPPLEGMFPMTSAPQGNGQGNIPVSSQPGVSHPTSNTGGFAFPGTAAAAPQHHPESFFGGGGHAGNTGSSAADIPTQPQQQQHQPQHSSHDQSSIPLLSKAAAESLASHQFQPSSTSGGLSFPVHDNGSAHHDHMQSSTYDEISRTAPWLLSVSNHQAPPTSAARSTDAPVHGVSSQPAFAPLPGAPITMRVEHSESDDDDDDDDVGDDPNDQDYAPQAPGFMSNPLMRAAARSSMGGGGSSGSAGQKRTRNSLGGPSMSHAPGGEAPDVPVEDGGLYLPESDEEDEYVQPSLPRKKPRKSNNNPSQSTPGPHRCDFVDDSGVACDTPFKRPYDLARHKETKHGLNNGKGKQEWICKNCKHNFSRKDALLRHQRVRHHS